MKSVYICYFGLREPLVETQVIPYLRELVSGGHEITLLTFEPRLSECSEAELEESRRRLYAMGIRWKYLKYHKRPSVPATLYDILQGARLVRGLVANEGVELLHARVHTPALMAVLAKVTSFGRRPRVLFDIRGFFPEEYVDAGIWKEDGLLFRAVKWVEKILLDRSDGFVVLTERARAILFPESAESGRDLSGRPVEVIPCCVDLERFGDDRAVVRQEMRSRLGVEGRFVVAYVGSFGGWYLDEETARFYKVLKGRRPDAFALILTQSDPAHITGLLAEAGYRPEEMRVGRVSSDEIASYLGAADAAVSLIKPCYSKQASSPTKIAEYLASGLPVIVNEGIGDSAEWVLADRVGAVVSEFSETAFATAIEELHGIIADGDVQRRSRLSAESRYSLKGIGGVRYRGIYGKLDEGGDGE